MMIIGNGPTSLQEARSRTVSMYVRDENEQYCKDVKCVRW
jgi:hypothetical protein